MESGKKGPSARGGGSRRLYGQGTPAKLKLVGALRKRDVDWSEIKELAGISRATYYRWQRRLQEEEGGGRRAKGFGSQTQTTQTPTAEGLLDARTTHLDRSPKKAAPHLGQVAHLADSAEAELSKSKSKSSSSPSPRSNSRSSSRLPGKRTHRRPHPGLPGSPRPRSERSLLPGPGKAGQAEEKEEEALRPKEAQSLPGQPPW